MWTEWLFQAEQGGSRLPDYMAPPVWNIHFLFLLTKASAFVKIFM